MNKNMNFYIDLLEVHSFGYNLKKFTDNKEEKIIETELDKKINETPVDSRKVSK